MVRAGRVMVPLPWKNHSFPLPNRKNCTLCPAENDLKRCGRQNFGNDHVPYLHNFSNKSLFLNPPPPPLKKLNFRQWICLDVCLVA